MREPLNASTRKVLYEGGDEASSHYKSSKSIKHKKRSFEEEIEDLSKKMNFFSKFNF